METLSLVTIAPILPLTVLKRIQPLRSSLSLVKSSREMVNQTNNKIEKYS